MTTPRLDDRLPRPTPPGWWAPCGDEVIVCTPAGPDVHVLSPSAAVIWRACAAGGTVGDLVGAIVDSSGAARPRVAHDVTSTLAAFASAGLTTPRCEPGEPDGRTGRDGDRGAQRRPGTDRLRGEPATSEDADPAGDALDLPVREWVGAGGDPRLLEETAAFRIDVLGEVVAVRGTDRAALTSARGLLRDLVTARPATSTLLVEVTSSGNGSSARTGPGTTAVRVWGVGAGHRAFDGVPAWLAALPTDLNRLVARSPVLALHAGAVVTQGGNLVLLPGPSGSGKSTLTAALVATGCTYVADEAVGIRPGTLGVVPYPKPLVLDETSRALLRVHAAVGDNVLPATLHARARTGAWPPVVGIDDAAPLDPAVIVAPTFVPRTDPTLEPLDTAEATHLLAGQAFNLVRSGQDGVATLAALVHRTPTVRLGHGDARAAATILGSWVDGLAGRTRS